MKKYVFRVAMTYTSPVQGNEYTMLIPVPANEASEALEIARKRYVQWQQDAKKFVVKYRWDYETHKTLAMLCGYADLYLWNTDCVPSDRRNP